MLVLNAAGPVLFTRSIQVMAVRPQASRHNRPGHLHERAVHVDHNIDTPKDGNQFLNGIVGCCQFHVDLTAEPLFDKGKGFLESGLIAPGHIER